MNPRCSDWAWKQSWLPAAAAAAGAAGGRTPSQISEFKVKSN